MKTRSIAIAITQPRMTPGAEQVLATAARLFYRHGIHAVGVDTIARESGVTKRTLYDRFGSKDALVAAYLRRRHEDWWARLEELIAETAGPRTLAVFDAYGDPPGEGDRGCAFLNAAGELPPDHPAMPVVREHKQAVLELLERTVAADAPHLADPGEVAARVFLLLEGAISHRAIDGDDRRLRQAREIARPWLDH